MGAARRAPGPADRGPRAADPADGLAKRFTADSATLKRTRTPGTRSPPSSTPPVRCAPAPDRIRACAREACALHFFDRSGNGTRRWCSMAVCGDRATASRHYARTHEDGERRPRLVPKSTQLSRMAYLPQWRIYAMMGSRLGQLSTNPCHLRKAERSSGTEFRTLTFHKQGC
ncbi:CGNR zinc finger domain-containing protein [Streptomyces sp. NPDC002926]